MKKSFTYLKAFFLVMLLVAGSGCIWGQQNTDPISSDGGVFFEFKGTSGYPAFVGTPEYWTKTGTVAGGGYIKLASGAITSPLYKAVKNATLTFSYDVAAFGSGKAGSLTVLSVYEQGSSEPVAYTMISANDKNYVKGNSLEFSAPANPFYVVINGQGDGAGGNSANKATRLQNISLTEVVTSSVAAPVFSPEAGTFYGPVNVSLSAPEADAVYYTTDVTKDPTTDGTPYSTPLVISQTTTVKAAAKKGTEFSEVISATYQILNLSAALPFNIDFKSGFGDCIVKKISGNTEWESTATGASINGYNKGNCESWIITPALTAQDLSLTFQSGTQYAGPSLMLLYSKDYNPSTMNDPNQATWTDITSLAKWPAASGGSVVWLKSGEVELKGLDAPVRIAFKYTGSNNPAAMWQVTDLAVKNATPVSDITPDNIESIGVLDQALTASGDWTQANIEMLALVISENKVPVTSVTFTGSVVSATDEIIGMAPNCLKIFADGVTAPAAWTTNVVKLDAQGNATSEKISLDASAAFGTPVKITADNADFLRPGLVSGNKSTLYVPFACTLPAGFAAYIYSGVEGTTVKFVPVEGTVLAANTPYLITPNSTEVNISETNVDILPEPGVIPPADYSFLGTYQTIPAVGFYGFKDNGFKLGIAGATVPAFRAYLKPATLPSGAPAVLGIDVTGGGTTAIDNAVLEGTTIYAADGVIRILTDRAQTINVYGIDGRLVRSESVGEGSHSIYGLTGGVYIVNNQKVIIK